jgi:hypothetical protein
MRIALTQEGTVTTGPCAWLSTACMTGPGPWCSDRLPRITRSARADRPASARPGWPWTSSWLTATSGYLARQSSSS